MSALAAVEAFVLGQLQGIESPPYAPAQAWITPLPIGDAGTAPQLFIGTSGYSERRRSNPRGTTGGTNAGIKTGSLTVKISCLAVWNNTDPQNDTAFKNLLGSIMDALRNAPMPAQLTDPVTEIPIQLQNLGEKIAITIDIVRALSNQQLYRWYAEIIADAQVAFHA